MLEMFGQRAVYRKLFILSVLGLFLFVGTIGYAAEKKKRRRKGKRGFRYDVIVMNRKSESRKKTNRRPVLFTHLQHARKYKCKVCHPKIFVKRKGANDINMQKNAEGKYCGKCHSGRFAFSLLECDICHAGDPVSDENAVRYAE